MGSPIYFPVKLRVEFALLLAGGVHVAADAPVIGSDVPWKAVTKLRFTSSDGGKPAEWLALVRTPAALFAVTSDVGSL